MSKQRGRQVKDKKKKLRATKRVRARRTELRARDREDKKNQQLSEEWEKKMERELEEAGPHPDLAGLEGEEKDAEIKKKLDRNIEILTALQEEYEAEQQARKNFNEKLESEGAETIEEKVNLTINKVKEIVQEQQIDESNVSIGGEADIIEKV